MNGEQEHLKKLKTRPRPVFVTSARRRTGKMVNNSLFIVGASCAAIGCPLGFDEWIISLILVGTCVLLLNGWDKSSEPES